MVKLNGWPASFRSVVMVMRWEWGREYSELFGIIAEADSDGASTPRPMWNVLPPFGPYWKAAYGHDCLYRGKAVIIINGERTDIKPTKDFCDETFLEMMECSDVDLEARTTIYEGVHLLGWKAFREDREQ